MTRAPSARKMTGQSPPASSGLVDAATPAFCSEARSEAMAETSDGHCSNGRTETTDERMAETSEKGMAETTEEGTAETSEERTRTLYVRSKAAARKRKQRQKEAQVEESGDEKRRRREYDCTRKRVSASKESPQRR